MSEPLILSLVVFGIAAMFGVLIWINDLPEPPIRGRNYNPQTPRPPFSPPSQTTPPLSPDQVRRFEEAFNEPDRVTRGWKVLTLCLLPDRIEPDIEDEP